MSTLSLLAGYAHQAATDLIAAPTITPQAPPGSEKFDLVLSWMKWLGGAIAVGSVMWCGYLFMFSPNRHQHDGTGALGKVAIGIVLFSSATALVGAFGL